MLCKKQVRMKIVVIFCVVDYVVRNPPAVSPPWLTLLMFTVSFSRVSGAKDLTTVLTYFLLFNQSQHLSLLERTSLESIEIHTGGLVGCVPNGGEASCTQLLVNQYLNESAGLVEELKADLLLCRHHETYRRHAVKWIGIGTHETIIIW